MELDDKLKPLTGLLCIDVRLIVGGSLILYLGHRPSETELAEWRMHIEPAWRLELAGSPVVGSFDAPESKEVASPMIDQLNKIRGRRLAGISVGAPILDLLLAFDDSYELRTFAHSTRDGENGEVRHQSGLRIAMREGSVCEWIEYTERPDRGSA